jgi:hemolysin III
MVENCVSFPKYSLGERVADGCLHVVGVTASLVALTVLLVIGIKSDTALWVVSLTVYGLALVATFSFSAGYNLVARPPRLKEWLRRFDHAAIFLMIAGTYTPFVLIQMNTPFGLILLAVVWTIAAIGIALQLFAPRYLRGLSVALYLVQARRRPLHRRRRVPSVGAAAVLERDLARLRSGSGMLPFHGRDLSRRGVNLRRKP